VMGTASFRTALIEISMDELGCAPSANEEIIYFLIKLFKISNMPRSQRNDDFIEGAHVLRQGAAAAAAAYFIRSPDVFQFDLLDSPGVEQLARDPQHAPTHRLLSLLLAGDVKVVPHPS